MIPISSLSGKEIALFGLGASGLATAEALLAGGALVVAWDDNPNCRVEAEKKHIPLVDLNLIEWRKYQALILAPGVPLTHPEPHWVVKLARTNGVEIIGDIELFLRERQHFLITNHLKDRDCPFIAITGTNGKSTTTALTDHLLRAAGCASEMGGNIGRAILTLSPFGAGNYYVIECSSFQIDLTPSLRPTIGCLLNITPDHIDRHGSFAHYAAIKKRLVANAGLALISIDDENSRVIAEGLISANHNVTKVSVNKRVEDGYFCDDDELCFAEKGRSQPLANLRNAPSLRGKHNRQNALMAVGVIRGLDIEIVDLEQALNRFVGLPHRMQLVRKIKNTLFINDSKATNGEATAPALDTFDRIYWILGGRAKAGGIEALRPFFPKVVRGYLIGEAASQFADTIGHAFPFEKMPSLNDAVARAAAQALADGSAENTVLLSPAAASYDQFANYGARGEAFVNCVQSINE